MLTPGEVIAANNSTTNRILGENNNVEFHIHAILGPFRNTRPSIFFPFYTIICRFG